MKKFNFVLNACVAIYVPATIHDTAVNNEKQVNEALALLSGMFGGATAQACEGAWLSDTCGLIKENTTKVYAYCSQADFEKNENLLFEYCEKLKNEMQQEAIAFEYNRKLAFV